MTEALVEVVRGELLEACHRGRVAVVDATGRVRAAVGDAAGRVVYWRSSAKPFQAMPLVSSGAAARWKLSSEDLALICASHSGEPSHVARLTTLLERLSFRASDLTCGAHPPLNPDAAAALLRAGREPTVLHNNCSGNHIGMLALARHLGVDPSRYASPGHPVQRELLQSVLRFSGLTAEEVVIGVDGCGVPTYGTTVTQMALAFARLMEPTDIEKSHADAARTVRDAMMAHPEIVGGTGRFDTDLMRIGRGRLLSKGGAGGVECIGIIGGTGLSIAVEDGAGPASPGRPTAVAAIEALRQIGALDQVDLRSLSSHARPSIRTVAGKPVGEARPVFTLVRTRAELRSQ